MLFLVYTVELCIYCSFICSLHRCVQVCGRGCENIWGPQPEEEKHSRHHTMGSHSQQLRPFRQRCES